MSATQLAAAGIWLLTIVHVHAAAAYPERPIRLIVPSPPGGGNDIMARLAAQRLSEAWGKQVVVDNRSGAGGAIAFETAARAEGDGYTLLLGSTNLTVLPDISKVNYDPIKDFAPISIMATSMNMLMVNPQVAAHSAKSSSRSRRLNRARSTTAPASRPRCTSPPSSSIRWRASARCWYPTRAWGSH